MTIDELMNDTASGNSVTMKIYNSKEIDPWKQLGIEDSRWQDLVKTSQLKIKASEEFYLTEFKRKMTSVEKLVEISKLTIHPNELGLLCFSLGILK